MSLHLHVPGGTTSPVTTPITLASQGGLLINIDSATGDIARTTTGWIENENLGWYGVNQVAGTSFEFDTAVLRTGTKTLKLSTTLVTGVARALTAPQINFTTATTNLTNSHYFVPCKPSTKYRWGFWVKTNNVPTNGFQSLLQQMGADGVASGSSSMTNLTGTNDWQYLQAEFTTGASAVYLGIFFAIIAGNVADAWVDVNSIVPPSEVVEPVANSLTSATPSIQSFTAVGSTDNIDQSLDPTFAAVLTYTPPVAISETATDKQTFVPTKSKMTRIGVFPVLKGTGNWTVTVHDASNVVQASITIANASLTNGAVNYFNVPCNLTALGTYHFHVTSTVADGTVKVTTLNDLETVSYIQNYYKPTTNFKASQNNTSISISADEDGFLDGSVISLTTAQYSYNLVTATKQTNTVNDFYSYIPPVTSGVNTYNCFSTTNQIFLFGATTPGEVIFKVNSGGLNFTSFTTSVVLANIGGSNILTVAYSTDNVTYTDFLTAIDDTGGTQSATTNGLNGLSVGYIKFYYKTGAGLADIRITNISFSGTIDTSTIPTLYNYPTNKDVTEYYTTTLSTPTTSATYRATKWGFPAIEYSATEYQFLRIDTTAALSVVQFSEAGSIFTTVADGASLAISSTSNPLLWVRTNITANRIYLSSNDYVASSDKDGSMKETVVYQVAESFGVGYMSSGFKKIKAG